MARKGKVGIDYFSHDVDMLQDKKIKLIKAKHGLTGYAVYLRLLEELYREEGYYLKIDDDFNILFSDDNNLNHNEYNLILNDCIEKGLFNKEIYDKHSVLTSARIQTNYCMATERRKNVEFIGDYLVIDVEKKYNLEKINVNILDLNVDINSENADIGTQSKVKESKVKESKGDNPPDSDEPEGDEPEPEFKFADDSDSPQYKCVKYLIECMKKNNPGVKAPKPETNQFETWCKQIDLMNRKDGRTWTEIKAVIDFSQNDSFWCCNILSAKKLREKYDQLYLKVKGISSGPVDHVTEQAEKMESW